MSDALLNEDLQKTLGFESISASQLSRNNNEINPEILSTLFMDLVYQIQQIHFKNRKNMPLKIIDSSTLPLNLTHYKWAKIVKQKREKNFIYDLCSWTRTPNDLVHN
ncbi:hypothetical protein [Aeribacillus alveayuensis]|uniref:Transposase n=1 Tax=Aeribacillus alveayuensis TaxID=279215 RepID=A0ABT9VNZ8_9BACI|nr:hypothetical protein [Bacillus alveayuensis]